MSVVRKEFADHFSLGCKIPYVHCLWKHGASPATSESLAHWLEMQFGGLGPTETDTLDAEPVIHGFTNPPADSDVQ